MKIRSNQFRISNKEAKVYSGLHSIVVEAIYHLGAEASDKRNRARSDTQFRNTIGYTITAEKRRGVETRWLIGSLAGQGR